MVDLILEIVRKSFENCVLFRTSYAIAELCLFVLISVHVMVGWLVSQTTNCTHYFKTIKNLTCLKLNNRASL